MKPSTRENIATGLMGLALFGLLALLILPLMAQVLYSSPVVLP